MSASKTRSTNVGINSDNSPSPTLQGGSDLPGTLCVMSRNFDALPSSLLFSKRRSKDVARLLTCTSKRRFCNRNFWVNHINYLGWPNRLHFSRAICIQHFLRHRGIRQCECAGPTWRNERCTQKVQSWLSRVTVIILLVTSVTIGMAITCVVSVPAEGRHLRA